jgi:hypothetical protein
MNPAFFKPNITIRMWLCGIPDEFEYPCVRVSVMRGILYTAGSFTNGSNASIQIVLAR